MTWPVAGPIPDKLGPFSNCSSSRRIQGCQGWLARRVAWRQCVRCGIRGGTPPAANGSTRSDCRRVAKPPRTAHSCRLLQGPTGLRLPVGEEIIDVGVRLHLSFFLAGQFTFIGSDIQFFNTDRISLGEVEGQNAFSEGPKFGSIGESRNAVAAEVEHPAAEGSHKASHGLRTGTCAAAKSQTLRETMVRL